ncbi:unnamed protein product [Hermetia illucens]|uniref:Adenosine 5'-monophosphoramidase HINT3 n=1 Tax=Hermetia illucens TaxID=343691 RepID=A0A7R8UKH1_HERIL|nr:histidine triad nucleotide-binding protein 3-like [Hermetia illucens]CAD7082511.1 unnamed protein product [Hermetia illucens]
MERCIFCKIVRGESPETTIEYESENIIVFKDIRPASQHHFLSVSKAHIDSAKCLKSEDLPLLNELEEALKKVFEEKGADIKDASFGFHWPPFTTVKHLHMHGISPVSTMGFMSKCIFKPNTLWFCTADCVRKRLEANTSS